MIAWVFILARKGSKRCPDKNVMPFDKDGTLVDRALRKLIKIAEIGDVSRIVLDTDIPMYLKKYKDHPSVSVIERDPALAGDDINPADIVYHDLKLMMDGTGSRPDCIVLSQATSPFWDEIDLGVCLDCIFENESGVISVNPSYKPNGCLYVILTEAFLAERTFFPKNVGFYKMKWWKSIDIDYLWDFRVAQAVLNE